jgi:2-amino-4-hydroxy-6-hydroxymethyldihydropteridine diphosphokinase
MTGLYLLLGSNLGDRVKNLEDARSLLQTELGPVVKSSSIYSTEPWGMTNAPAFLNQVLLLACQTEPLKILDVVLEIETRMGRTRQQGYQNRTIDIDILYLNDLVYEDQQLVIPHPRISERRFVLQPLVEIAPYFIHPVLQLTNRQLMDQCQDQLFVRRVDHL